MTTRQAFRQRRAALGAHLKAESPDLLPVLDTCRDFDRVLRGLGLLRRNESVAARLSWWPVVSLFGATGAGRLDAWLGASTDEGVTVFCHGTAAGAAAQDPRVPLGLLGVQPLTVRGVAAEGLRGGVLVAAPDVADAAAAPVVASSDLVLALPAGPGAVRPSGGRVQALGSEELADPGALRARVAEAAVRSRYRLLGTLGEMAQDLEDELIPYLRSGLARWRRGVRRGAVLWVMVLAAVLGGAVMLAGPETLPAFGRWLLDARPAWAGGLPVRLAALLASVGGLWLAGHLWVRRFVAYRVASGMPRAMAEGELDPRRAFLRNTRFYRSTLSRRIAGWGWLSRRRFAAVRRDLVRHGQALEGHASRPVEPSATAQAGAGA